MKDAIQTWTVNSGDKCQQFIHFSQELFDRHKYVTFTWKVGEPTRTTKQNNSLHVYNRQLGQALNSAGLDMRKVLKQEIEIPWTEHSTKKHLWTEIQLILTGKESSTEITSKECQEIYQVLDRHIAQKFGVSIPWPSLNS
tara:strand:- start:92 stop:511 length:420 start_codon:yes stop_codon:yes gene_type:complete